MGEVTEMNSICFKIFQGEKSAKGGEGGRQWMKQD